MPYYAPGRVFDDEGANSHIPAFEVLKEIINDKKIYGSRTETGFIKGGHSAVCFSEVPFSGLKYMLRGQSRYEPYGLIFGKVSIFKNGGRPVIYLPDSDGTWIPHEEKWRHVRYEPGIVDYTFEREWRLKGDLDLNKTSGFYIIVKDMKEKAIIENYKLAKCSGIFVFNHITQMF